MYIADNDRLSKIKHSGLIVQNEAAQIMLNQKRPGYGLQALARNPLRENPSAVGENIQEFYSIPDKIKENNKLFELAMGKDILDAEKIDKLDGNKYKHIKEFSNKMLNGGFGAVGSQSQIAQGSFNIVEGPLLKQSEMYKSLKNVSFTDDIDNIRLAGWKDNLKFKSMIGDPGRLTEELYKTKSAVNVLGILDPNMEESILFSPETLENMNVKQAYQFHVDDLISEGKLSEDTIFKLHLGFDDEGKAIVQHHKFSDLFYNQDIVETILSNKDMKITGTNKTFGLVKNIGSNVNNSMGLDFAMAADGLSIKKISSKVEMNLDDYIKTLQSIAINKEARKSVFVNVVDHISKVAMIGMKARSATSSISSGYLERIRDAQGIEHINGVFGSDLFKKVVTKTRNGKASLDGKSVEMLQFLHSSITGHVFAHEYNYKFKLHGEVAQRFSSYLGMEPKHTLELSHEMLYGSNISLHRTNTFTLWS